MITTFIRAPEGIIKSCTGYNPLWNRIQVHIDGTVYAQFPPCEYRKAKEYLEKVDKLSDAKMYLQDHMNSYGMYSHLILRFKGGCVRLFTRQAIAAVFRDGDKVCPLGAFMQESPP